MKKIDRYIFFKLIKAFLFVVLLLMAIIIIINITERNEDFIRHGVTAQEIIGYYLAYFPYMANQLTPITIFIAAVFITSQLATHTEIIAMLSSGISFRRILVPYMAAALLVAIASFFLTGWIIPNSNKARIEFEIAYFGAKKAFNKHNIHLKIGPTTYFYLGNFNNQTQIGYKCTLETIDSTQLNQKLEAQRLEWNEDEQNWKMVRWRLHTFDGIKETFSSGDKLDTTLLITPKDFDSNYMDFETLTMDELDDKIAELEARGADDVIIYKIDKYIRYMSPFAVLVLVFIGAIVSSQKTRGGTGFQIALGFLLAFIFLILYVFARSIAEAQTFNPIVAVWIPNIIFTFIGIFLYARLPK